MDSVTLTVIYNALVNIAREMGLTMMRTSYSPIFNEALDYDTRAVAKYLSGDGIRGHLEAFERVLKSVEPFAASPLESGLRSLAAARGVKPATLIHATRVAVTGRAVSPGLFEVLELLGRERCLERLRQAMGIASA